MLEKSNLPGRLLQIDGRRLYYSFIAGTRQLLEGQAELNRINVFPVSDGDTGSNMAATVRSVFDSIPHRSYKITLDRIAKTAMLNARGNSGIIFAQMLYGLSNETGNYASITLPQFAESIRNSIRYMYEAISRPVEGTMLTVIREWADFIHHEGNKSGDFNQVLISSDAMLEKSLQETKGKLSVLAKANVVDAGASGFVLFIKGIISFIRSSNIRSLLTTVRPVILPSEGTHIPQEVSLRYCTEAILQQEKGDHAAISSLIEKYGDSGVVAGSGHSTHLHLHTNDPAEFFDELKELGTITFQKCDDMVRQSESVYRRKWKIALVTDSTCDLPQELIDNYQIHVLPIHISFGENQYLDKITLKPEQFYRQLEENKAFPKTAQINEQAFNNLYSHLASHYDSIIAVHLTGRFSGTYFNSYKAGQTISREFGKPVSVIDSRNLSGALGLIILRMAKAIEAGIGHAELVEMANRWISDTRIFVSVKTMKYMVRGGRVTHFKGFVARLLNINPIISMDAEGKSVLFGKAFSQAANMKKVMDHILKNYSHKKIWNYIVLHANNPEAASWYAGEMKRMTGADPVSQVNISPVVGANAGIGAASVAFMVE